MTRDERTTALRDETPAQRFDRNWNEVLQELRVVQTGTQILTGFLLALAFQPTFVDLTWGQKMFYLGLVVLSGLSAIIAFAPVALHRILFGEGAKGTIVAYGHIALLSALVVVSLLLVGVVGFVFDFMLGFTVAVSVAAGLAVLVIILWVAIPLYLKKRQVRATW